MKEYVSVVLKLDQLTWWPRVWISPVLWPAASDPAPALKLISRYVFAPDTGEVRTTNLPETLLQFSWAQSHSNTSGSPGFSLVNQYRIVSEVSGTALGLVLTIL